MSIVKLKKMTAYGHTDNKDEILNDFQNMGCLHLIPLNIQEDLLHNVGPTSESRDALKFLTSCPQRLQQMENSAVFDAADVAKFWLSCVRGVLYFKDHWVPCARRGCFAWL